MFQIHLNYRKLFLLVLVAANDNIYYRQMLLISKC